MKFRVRGVISLMDRPYLKLVRRLLINDNSNILHEIFVDKLI